MLIPASQFKRDDLVVDIVKDDNIVVVIVRDRLKHNSYSIDGNPN